MPEITYELLVPTGYGTRSTRVEKMESLLKMSTTLTKSNAPLYKYREFLELCKQLLDPNQINFETRSGAGSSSARASKYDKLWIQALVGITRRGTITSWDFESSNPKYMILQSVNGNMVDVVFRVWSSLLSKVLDSPSTENLTLLADFGLLLIDLHRKGLYSHFHNPSHAAKDAIERLHEYSTPGTADFMQEIMPVLADMAEMTEDREIKETVKQLAEKAEHHSEGRYDLTRSLGEKSTYRTEGRFGLMMKSRSRSRRKSRRQRMASPKYCRTTPVSKMGFTQRSSCKAQGLIARTGKSNKGQFVKSPKYMSRKYGMSRRKATRKQTKRRSRRVIKHNGRLRRSH